VAYSGVRSEAVSACTLRRGLYSALGRPSPGFGLGEHAIGPCRECVDEAHQQCNGVDLHLATSDLLVVLLAATTDALSEFVCDPVSLLLGGVVRNRHPQTR
jgi:hypothetical protein